MDKNNINSLIKESIIQYFDEKERRENEKLEKEREAKKKEEFKKAISTVIMWTIIIGIVYYTYTLVSTWF
jgi:CHASE3 domain sensor protein